MDKQSGLGRPLKGTILIALAGAGVAAGIWYYLGQTRGGRDTAEAPPPSTEWTSAPEGGVDVELPETPMTNAPAPAPEPVSEPLPDSGSGPA